MEQNILQELAEIKRNTLLAAKNVLTLSDVALLTNLSEGYLYTLTSKKLISHYKPNGRLLYFDRSEVEEWQKRNRITTVEEAEGNAAAYCAMKGGAA